MDIVIWKKCIGEAHKPEIAGNIDHCMVCMPYWEFYPTCPECGTKVQEVKKKNTSCNFYCQVCHRYLVNDPEESSV